MPTKTADIDPVDLAKVIRDAGKPVHINVLARTVATSWLNQVESERGYAPGAFYEEGENIQLYGRSATITVIQPGHNPKQGEFQILQLTFADGSHKQIAAGIEGAPNNDRIEITPEQLQKRQAQDGLSLRTAVQDKLAEDDQFIYFQDEQGDQWCLAELLPTLTDDELQQVRPALYSTADDPFPAVPTETLVATVWDYEDDGSNEYQLFAFALNAALQEYRDAQYVAGAGWMLAEHWRKLELRPSLVGPRMANIVPEATDEEEEEAQPDAVPKPAEGDSELPTDIELWREQRRNEVAFTLRASHFYYHWLPLSSQMQRLFPIRPCRITIHLNFEDKETSFTAAVNPDQKCVLCERTMHDTFHELGIYPGAKLIISHRGTEYDYDLRTRPIEGEQSVIVRHISLDDDGQLKYWDDEEPLRYQVDGDVFVADARWEDLPALFQQAEEAGQGIFGLMYEKCHEWEQERGTPLIVTAKELFDNIHFGSRLTSKATIAFELWRRLAFAPLGQGRYQFRPEKRKQSQSYGLTGRQRSTLSKQATRRGGKTKSLTQQENTFLLPQLNFTANDLWAALMADDNQRLILKAAVSAYKVHPFRDKMCFLREAAHQRIRQLLSPDRLDALSLADFNQQVWQLGTVTYQGHRARIDSIEVETLLKDIALADVKKANVAGELLLAGNQTWGSATSVYGAQLRHKTDAQKVQLLRHTLRDLLYGADEDEQRIARTIQESNGFGINIISGLLHAVYPQHHILYNIRSFEMLTSLGIGWPGNWRKNARVYLVYRDFMQRLRAEFGFASLTDVDWFVYGWGSWQTGRDAHDSTEPPKRQHTSRKPVFETTKSGQLMATDLVPIGPLFEETVESEEAASPAIGYFILQQKPESEYEDQTGHVYNWRQGIPGSKQIQPGARFIYYRPGEQVFFGCGRVEWIELSKDEEGCTIYNGQISDYEQWKPPLPLTRSLANKLNFVQPGRLGIGQAGIRKITIEDYESIRKAFRQKVAPNIIDDADIVDGEKAVAEERPILQADEFVRMKDLVQAYLKGETIYTPTGIPNIITDITSSGLLVQSSKSEAEIKWEWIEEVYDVLRELGAIEKFDVQKGKHRVRGGFRSAFIFGLLARFNHIAAQNRPQARLVYHPPREEIQLRPIGHSPADTPLLEPDEPAIWTEERIIAQFQAIQVWRQGDKIAPHKPLLLIYALAQCKQGAPRLIPYSQIDYDLTQMLIQFNQVSQSQHPEYPFWRLQNDGLWEIPGADQLVTRKSNTDAKRSELLRHNIAGGFHQALYDVLRRRTDLIDQLVKTLLDGYFPPSHHDSVREAVGLVPSIDEKTAMIGDQ